MKKLLLVLSGGVFIAIGAFADAPVLAQVSKRSLEARTATCRADCRTGNTHGLYKAYNTSDPKLSSPEGRKMYAECVRLCLAPLPVYYFQRPIIDAGLPWFGKTAKDCLECHSSMSPRFPSNKPSARVTGETTRPDALKRDR